MGIVSQRARTSLRPIRRDFKKNKSLYALALVGVGYYLLFHYLPMYGVVIAFKEYSPARGILGSPWAGLDQFTAFFKSYYFWRLLSNTLVLSVLNLLWGFPAPIILALLLNEVRRQAFKKTVQIITYVPHFVSLVVICGMIVDFVSSEGIVNDLFALFGAQERVNFLSRPEYFRTVYIASGIWQEVGWGSIIYLAALSGIDPSLYEAAEIDGAGRLRKMLSVTLPCLVPTIVILLILRMGTLMSLGYEKIILLYNPITYETADVISSFVYRKGLLESSYSYSAAVGLFNSAVNLFLLLGANSLSRRVNETSLF